MKRAWLWWLAVLVPMWVTMVLCTHWEPVQRDGWGMVDWHRATEVTPATIWHFLYNESWLISNPRIGRLFTLLLYADGPWKSIVTPIVELGMFGLLAAVALGRWPSPRRSDDALLYLTIVAITCVSIPELGAMLFYRAFTGNYLYGLVLELLWILPYRFHAEAPRVARWWWAPGMFVLGVLAGTTNEHTVPAFALAAGFAGFAFVRRGERLAAWMIAGLVGLIAGYLVLMLAPGQHVRYDGLATQHTILGLIASRGFYPNFHIVWRPAYLMFAAAPWVIVAVIARGGTPLPRIQRSTLIAMVVVAVVILVTLMGSPKQGARLNFAAMILAATAISAWIVPRLVATWARAACAVMGGAILALSCVCAIVIYHAVAAPGEKRVELLYAAPAGSKVVLPPLPAGKTRWFLGDELATPKARHQFAEDYHLASVERSEATDDGTDGE